MLRGMGVSYMGAALRVANQGKERIVWAGRVLAYGSSSVSMQPSVRKPASIAQMRRTFIASVFLR